MIELDAVVSVASARRALAAAFHEAGVDTPELDARVLLGHALGVDPATLAAEPERILCRQEAERLRALAVRRARREPVARIVGTKEFWSLRFLVSPYVLVPRPETETLVEAALDLLRVDPGRPLRIADLGTGSGALLLALLHEIPGAAGVGTDVSPAALAVARENARRLGLEERATFVACDFGTALGGGFDLVVSNPPYVAQAEWRALDPEVRDHDPKLALDGGADGLAAYRRIAADVQRLITPGAYMILELGAGMADRASAVFAAPGVAIRGTRPDLNKVPRALVLQRPLEAWVHREKTA